MGTTISSWTKLVASITSCRECTTFPELLPSLDGIMLPNPSDYAPRVKLLFVSWAPPGKPKAVDEQHFFHNPKAPDNLRTRIFNGLTKTGSDFQLDPKAPEKSLELFYRMGLYLVPTIFRRIKDDQKPSDSIIVHSSNAHLKQLLYLLARRQGRLRIVVLGETPSRAFAELFQDQEAGKQIASALRRQRPVATARNLTTTRPLSFRIDDSYLDVWISNWPRGQGYRDLPNDILRGLGYAAQTAWDSNHPLSERR